MVVGIIDLAHCGTTMTAGVLERIGVPMVLNRGKRSKLEDLDVIEALREDATFEQLTKQRQGITWGFKYPGAWLFADRLRMLDEAVFLAIYKDPVSVTQRRFGKIGGGKLAKTVSWMQRSIDGINESGLPVHWLSYAHAIRYPCEFTGRLGALAGIRPTYGQIDSVLEWMFPKGQGVD